MVGRRTCSRDRHPEHWAEHGLPAKHIGYVRPFVRTVTTWRGEAVRFRSVGSSSQGRYLFINGPELPARIFSWEHTSWALAISLPPSSGIYYTPHSPKSALFTSMVALALPPLAPQQRQVGCASLPNILCNELRFSCILLNLVGVCSYLPRAPGLKGGGRGGRCLYSRCRSTALSSVVSHVTSGPWRRSVLAAPSPAGLLSDRAARPRPRPLARSLPAHRHVKGLWTVKESNEHGGARSDRK